MRGKNYGCFWLALIAGGLCAAGRLMQVFYPAVILPKPDVSLWTLLSVTALLLANGRKPAHRFTRVFDIAAAIIAFAAFPLLSGLVDGGEVWRLALGGGLTYAVTAEVIDAMRERMVSGGRGKAALAVNGLMLVLAVQAFNHIVM